MGMDQYGRMGGIDKGVFVRFNPWHAGYDEDHKLITNENLSIDEMVEYAFGWTVQPRQSATNFGTPENPVWVVDDEWQSITRSDNGFVLSKQLNSYQAIDPGVLGELAKVAIAVDGSFDSGIKNAAALFRGKVTFLYLQRANKTRLGGGAVVLERGLCLITSQDGSYSISGMPTNTVAQCMNTVPNPNGRSLYSIKHTKGAMDLLPEMKAAIAEAYMDWDSLDIEVEKLLATPFTRAQFTDLLVPALMGETPERKPGQTDRGYATMLTKRANKKDKIIAEWGGTNQEGTEGTGWHAVMGVNSFELWEKTVQGDRQERQLMNAIKGHFPMTAQAREIVLATA